MIGIIWFEFSEESAFAPGERSEMHACTAFHAPVAGGCVYRRTFN